jgi:outer membrane protein
MTESKLGLDIRRQVVAYEDNMTAEFGAEAQALQKETDALQKQSAASPPNVRAKKAQALQAREDAYQQKVGARQKLIQGGEMVARQRYLTEVGMLVHAIMLERGADMVIVKSSVADSVDGLNITQTVIHRLDQKIPSLKVTLVAPPPTSSIQIH